MIFIKTILTSCLFLFFVAIESNYCQTEGKENILHLTGRTLNDSLSPIPYVHIILVNRKLGSASDLKGFFNFPAEVNDTILFKAIGYKYSKLVVRDTFLTQYPYIPIKMVQDTIQLKEMVITPWQGNYGRFKEAVMSYKLPVTDLDRAHKNLNAMELKSLLLHAPVSPTMAFKNTMKVANDRLYWAGQLPPITITNPLAWAQFIKALNNGDLKNK